MNKTKNKGFFVLEQEDCENYLTVTEQNILKELQKKVFAGRHINGKNMREKYLVINKSDTTFKEITELLAELKELNIDIERWVCKGINLCLVIIRKGEYDMKVSFREIDRAISEYPKDTIFVLDHDDVRIPLPTKEEIKTYFNKKEDQNKNVERENR